MRIEQLEYLAAVARFGSFRRAGEELHLSQPALSETVRKLESELGVRILDRKRSGATISDGGRELLPHILNVIEAAESLRRAADDQHENSRLVRLGTVSAATVPLLTPTMWEFRERNPATQIEVIATQQERIHRDLLEGSLDLGLVNYLETDELPGDFHTTELLRGRPVLCIRADSHLAGRGSVSAADLAAEPMIAMRSGYVMHRYLHRLIGGRDPSISFSTDGAEMGKLMVAEGLGSALLPDYSVIGDPLERSGAITYLPIEGDDISVLLVIQRRESRAAARAVQDLERLFVEFGRRFTATHHPGDPVPAPD